MPNDDSRFRVGLDVDAGVRRSGEEEAPRRMESEHGYCIAVLGDFSGRGSRGAKATGREVAVRRPLRVDRDNLDDVLGDLEARLRVELIPGASPIEIPFASLEDFHPDRLYERLTVFRNLRDSRHRAATTADILPAAPSRPAQRPAGDLLEAMLGDSPALPGGAALATPPSVPTGDYRPPGDRSLEEFVQRAVAPHLAAEPSRRAAEAEARIDGVIEALMRVLLHHPGFQGLEAAWRGVDFLIRRLETDEKLRVYLIDVSREELEADLAIDGAEGTGAIRQLLVDKSSGTPGGIRWSLIVGCYSFGDESSDFGILERLASVAAAADAPFISAASAALAGSRGLALEPDPDDWTHAVSAEWDRLRRSPLAAHIGLTFPRILLRLPYGAETDACEDMTFEEMAPNTPPEHESYLWGSGAFAYALHLAESFASPGPILRGKVTDLPLHIWRANGEATATPCAEILISERAAERVIAAGLMPLLSVRDTDEVILPRIQSIGSEVRRLAGGR